MSIRRKGNDFRPDRKGGHRELEFFGVEDAIVNLNFVDETIEALSCGIGSVTSVTTNNHWESMSCHGAPCSTGSLDSVDEDNLIAAVIGPSDVSPLANWDGACIVEVISPTTIVNICVTISTDSVVKLAGVSRSVFLTEDHVVDLA